MTAPHRVISLALLIVLGAALGPVPAWALAESRLPPQTVIRDRDSNDSTCGATDRDAIPWS